MNWHSFIILPLRMRICGRIFCWQLAVFSQLRDCDQCRWEGKGRGMKRQKVGIKVREFGWVSINLLFPPNACKKHKDYRGSRQLLNLKHFSISEFHTCSGEFTCFQSHWGWLLCSKVPKGKWHCVGGEHRLLLKTTPGSNPTFSSTLPLTNSMSPGSQLTSRTLSLLICKIEIIIIPLILWHLGGMKSKYACKRHSASHSKNIQQSYLLPKREKYIEGE